MLVISIACESEEGRVYLVLSSSLSQVTLEPSEVTMSLRSGLPGFLARPVTIHVAAEAPSGRQTFTSPERSMMSLSMPVA